MNPINPAFEIEYSIGLYPNFFLIYLNIYLEFLGSGVKKLSDDDQNY